VEAVAGEGVAGDDDVGQIELEVGLEPAFDRVGEEEFGDGAFADAILSLDDSMPNGTYIDMCSKLPVVDPLKIAVPTVVLRGQFDGIAGFDDLLQFFKLLPHPDKQFTVLNGISHASFQQKNYKMVYQILHAYFTQPEPAYTDYSSH